MILWGNTVTGTVLIATEFSGFYVHVIKVSPLTFKGNAMVYRRTFLCVIQSSAET